MRSLYFICRSFGRAERGAIFGTIDGRMDEECFVEFAARVQLVQSEVVVEYVKLSQEKEKMGEAKLTSFSSIIAIGGVPDIPTKE